MTSVDPSAVSTEDCEFLEENDRAVVLQQLFASEHAALTFEELQFRLPMKSRVELQQIVDELVGGKCSFATRLRVPGHVTTRYPVWYYAPTEYGVAALKATGNYESAGVFYQLYDAIERTTRIQNAEAVQSRPSPDWLETERE